MTHHRLWLAALALASTATASAADPVAPQILNVSAAQRPGTFLVDIDFDLVDPDSNVLMVWAEASVDGGATYPLPVSPATGDVGIITPGAGKRMTWKAWYAYGNNYAAGARIRLVADDRLSRSDPPPQPAPAADLNMAWIPPGSFANGTWNVQLTRGYWINKYEVTQAEYLAVMGANPSTAPSPSYPVHNVTWNNAVAYCTALTTREQNANRIPAGWSFRLPTEAEWEYASRGGVTTDRYFGDPNVVSPASYAYYTINGGGRPHEVGSLGQNRFGLFDMYGNVFEWCLDEYTSVLPSGTFTDPPSPPDQGFFLKVLRGGSFLSPIGEISSVFRSNLSRNAALNSVGFRVVLARPVP